jgi:Flp pilus assembly protein TadD
LFDTVNGLIQYRNSTEPPRTIEIDSVMVDITGPANAIATARYRSIILVPGNNLKVANLDILLLEKQHDNWIIKAWNPQEYFHVVYDGKIKSVWNYKKENSWRFCDASNEIRYLFIYLLEENKKNGKTPADLGEVLAARFSGMMITGRGFSDIVASQVRNIQTFFWKNIEVPEITGTSAMIRFDPVIGMLMESRNINEKEYIEFFDAFFRSLVKLPGYKSKLTNEGDTWLLTMGYDPNTGMDEEVTKALEKRDTLRAELIKSNYLMRQGKAEEASNILTSLMKRYPDNKEVVQNWVMANAKNFQSAEQMHQGFDKLENEFPENKAILFWKAFIEASTGKNEEALSNIDQLIVLQPDSAINWSLKSQVMTNLNRYPEALEAINKSLAMDGKLQGANTTKTVLLIKMGEYDQALESVNKDILLMPGNVLGYYNRACIYSLKGDKSHALSDLKKAIEINPWFKQNALQDEDFKNLKDDEDFKALVK